MKILLDNCIDVRAADLFSGHEVVHARDLGWHDLENGRLLAAAAEAGFLAIVTVDKNIQFQQNLERLPLAVIELDVLRNRLSEVAELAGAFAAAIEQARSHLFVTVQRGGSVTAKAPRPQE